MLHSPRGGVGRGRGKGGADKCAQASYTVKVSWWKPSSQASFLWFGRGSRNGELGFAFVLTCSLPDFPVLLLDVFIVCLLPLVLTRSFPAFPALLLDVFIVCHLLLVLTRSLPAFPTLLLDVFIV